ncbi:MAG: glycosyl transferase [Cyanobacteria bacterium RM1_2_2]|nr:glycosyl transferase [Cyanobacteria bacterium RM1_2_2]
MEYTPFSKSEAIQFLKNYGIVTTNSQRECDILVGRCFRPLTIAHLFTGKTALLWTHEPRFDTHFEQTRKMLPGGLSVEIMNAYTGDIYFDNYSRYGNAFKTKLRSYEKQDFEARKHKTAILALYRNDKAKWSLKRNGVELDLCYLRTQIALAGHQMGFVDIYGKDWPRGFSIEDSRRGKWKDRKREILGSYRFNICFENTNYNYYCTEKIWDSIQAGCLPVYYGNGNKIYENFPSNSFLDYCDFESTDELFDYMQRMNFEEFRERINLCIKAGNEVLEKRSQMKFFDKVFSEQMLSNIVDRLYRIHLKA